MSRPRRKREPTDATVRAALASIPPSIEREAWVRVAMALKSFYGDAGLELFDHWSSGADNYQQREVRSVWRGIKEGGGTTVGTLFHEAAAHGFDLAAQYAAEEAAEAAGVAVATPGPSPEELERRAQAQRERDAQAHAEREREQAQAASLARQRWEAAATSGQSAYLERKGIEAHSCRFEPGGRLLVPMRDVGGVLWSVQTIEPNGTKSFPKGARVKGLHCWIGDPACSVDLIVAEGYATAVTLHLALGVPVAVAFNAGNLVEVARELMGHFPGVRWIVAADDDRDTLARIGRNPGIEAARQAAYMLGALMVVPKDLPEGGTDFNDLAKARGLPTVADQVDQQLLDPASIPAAPSKPKRSAAGGRREKVTEDHVPVESPKAQEQGNPVVPKERRRARKARSAAPEGAQDGQDEGGRPDPFMLTDEGVFYVSRDSGGAWVTRKLCAPIEVVGESRNLEGFGWGKLVRYVNRDGERREWVLPAEVFAGDGVELRKTLASLGLWITPISSLRGRLIEYFETREVAARVRTVGVTGWCEGAFVLPGETIGSGADPIVYHTPGDPSPLRLEQRGTLAAWRREVARRCERNSRLMFAVSLAFAAPLLALSAERNGGFHFRGTSQDGKTTALTMAASVFGSPAYVRKWRATDNAVEGVAALHSDLPLLLDELHQCPPKLVGDVAYLLAEGQGKARGERSGGLRSILRWRTLFLSTGETGLTEYMATAGIQTTAGQEMRFAEIPATPEGGFGVFEDLHGEPSGEAFALRLRGAVASQYGTAGRTWLEWLVEHRAAAELETQQLIGKLSASWVPAGAAGQVASVARRFLLVGIGGELATRAGITGWPKGAAMAAARACFDAWIEVRGGSGRSEERELLRRLRSFLQENAHRFEWWERAHDDRAPKTLNRAGFRKRYFDGEPVERDSDVHRLTGSDSPSILDAERMTVDYYVFMDVFRREVFRDTDARTAHRVLIERGIVKTERNGTTVRPYRRERLPNQGRGQHSTVYAITSEGFGALEEALQGMGF